MNKRRYYSVSEYYKNVFGSKVYKISVDAGCTCPNRDGTKDTRGCIFCSASGSGDFCPSRSLTITEQVEEAKKLVVKKIPKDVAQGKYIVYFQNFTNTYGNEEELEKKYKEALSCSDVVGIAIATRPDSISEKILTVIKNLAKETYVSVELGLQTVKEKSVNYIRRHYENAEYFEAINRIKKASEKIHIVTHVIFGLPNETKEDMIETVRTTIRAGTDGIKFTVLHVLKNTDLAKDYEVKKFRVMEMQDYFNVLKEALLFLPEHIVVHRLTGDGDKKNLIAPKWTEAKHHVRNEMKKFFAECDLVQGKNTKEEK